MTCPVCPGPVVEWEYTTESGMVDGQHVFELRARDSTGVRSDVLTRTVTVDTKRPAVASSDAVSGTEGASVITVQLVEVNLDCQSAAWRTSR